MKQSTFDNRLTLGLKATRRSLLTRAEMILAVSWVAIPFFIGGTILGGQLAAASRPATPGGKATTQIGADDIPAAGWVAAEARLRQRIIDLTRQLKEAENSSLSTRVDAATRNSHRIEEKSEAH